MPNAQCPNMHALPTLLQVEACAELTATGERRFDSREFAMLVRYVCSEVEPAGELLRAFETFDPRGHNAVSADALVTQLINNGAPQALVRLRLRLRLRLRPREPSPNPNASQLTLTPDPNQAHPLRRSRASSVPRG